jgi:hypothetical protein
VNLINATIKGIANKFGFKIIRISKITSSSMVQDYETVLPSATYSPWDKDNLFQKVLASIAEITPVDKYRCFEL